MPDITLTVPRLDDASIVRLFRDIATQFKPFDCSASLIAINVTINLNANQPSQLLELVTKQNSFALHSAHASFRQLILRWWRGGENKNNPWFDEVKFQRVEQQNQGPEFSDVERLELINFVNERLGPSVPPPQPGAIGLNDVEALYRSTILKLETSFAQQLERLTSWSVEQAGEFERLKLELAEQTQHEREKLQAERDEMTVSQKAAADELNSERKRSMIAIICTPGAASDPICRRLLQVGRRNLDLPKTLEHCDCRST